MGDLAVVIGARRTPEVVGRLVEVVRPAVDGARLNGGRIALFSPEEPSWIVRAVGDGLLPGSEKWGKREPSIEGISLDRCLRPIRDPGDDAKDETLEWLPVPQQVVA